MNKEKIKQSFLNGSLLIQTVDPNTNEVFYAPVLDVLQHHTPHKKCFLVQTQTASITVTEDHSLFTFENNQIKAIPTNELSVGSHIVCVEKDEISLSEIISISETTPLELSYDLSVPMTENFIISNGILAHNSYSIGGISLDIERSSKYESLKGNAEGQLDKAAEIKSRTTKLIRGLMQPKYGRGVRSSFGPNSGRGILSPRNFV